MACDCRVQGILIARGYGLGKEVEGERIGGREEMYGNV